MLIRLTSELHLAGWKSCVIKTMLLESCSDIHKNSTTLSRLCTVRLWPFPLQRATALMWAGRSQCPFNDRLIRHFQTCGSFRLGHCGPSSGNRTFLCIDVTFVLCYVISSELSSCTIWALSGWVPLGSHHSAHKHLEQGLCLGICLFLTRQSFFFFCKIKKLLFFKIAGLSIAPLRDVNLLDGCETYFF